ncbi:MAG: type II toxin-antitoxin system RelE/ParE family toxin [Planctomycetota bacterium]
MQVLQTPVFEKIKKKLKKNQIQDLDKAVRKIIANPEIGTKKTGDLSDIWIYKFKMAKQENLLAYQWDPKRRILIALGVHENFYRDLKKYRKL